MPRRPAKRFASRKAGCTFSFASYLCNPAWMMTAVRPKFNHRVVESDDRVPSERFQAPLCSCTFISSILHASWVGLNRTAFQKTRRIPGGFDDAWSRHANDAGSRNARYMIQMGIYGIRAELDRSVTVYCHAVAANLKIPSARTASIRSRRRLSIEGSTFSSSHPTGRTHFSSQSADTLRCKSVNTHNSIPASRSCTGACKTTKAGQARRSKVSNMASLLPT